MGKVNILEIALAFRKAIQKAKRNQEFAYGDRMNNFPGGCCDDSCDLLSFFLNEQYGIHSMQRNGVYRDENPNNTTNHAWLILDDKKTVIDITADQFRTSPGYVSEVYVGIETIFYKSLEEKREFENYNITLSPRLWSDYNHILQYLPET